MLFMSFLHHSVTGVRGRVDRHVTVLALGVTMRILAVRRPGFRRARTPVPRSQNPASRPRTGPGSPSRSSSCTRPRVTTPNASNHSAATARDAGPAPPHRGNTATTTALLGLHLVPATVMIPTLARSLRSRTD
jgi:hypothetical protein